MFFVHCVGGCIGQKKPDQGNSWWSQLIIDLPDETPTASCCPLSFHIVSECFMCFFPNGSPCFTMLHHFSHVFIMFSPLHHVSQCFRLFYIGKWWWKHWEMVVSPMFHLCPSFFHRLTELLLTISETFVHHFFFRFSHMLNRCFTICNTMIKPFCVTSSHLSWFILTFAISECDHVSTSTHKIMCHTGSTSRQVAAQALCRQRAIASWQLNQHLWLCIYIMYKDDVYIYIYM